MSKRERDKNIFDLPNILDLYDLENEAINLISDISTIIYSENNPLTSLEARNLTFLKQKVAHKDASIYNRAIEFIDERLQTSENEGEFDDWQIYVKFLYDKLSSRLN